MSLYLGSPEACNCCDSYLLTVQNERVPIAISKINERTVPSPGRRLWFKATWSASEGSDQHKKGKPFKKSWKRPVFTSCEEI